MVFFMRINYNILIILVKHLTQCLSSRSVQFMLVIVIMFNSRNISHQSHVLIEEKILVTQTGLFIATNAEKFYSVKLFYL